MSRKIVRVGIVGSGFAARFHYEALLAIHTAEPEVVGVWSPTAEHRDAFAAERGIRSFPGLGDLIDAVDVIHVCSPPASHDPVCVAALEAGRSVVVEKPFTGYFGDGSADFDGDTFDRTVGIERAMASVRRLRDAEAASAGRIYYAENWVYAPAIQKEREIIEKTGAQLLWIHGEESHSGSHSPYSGIWSHSGGGSLVGKGVHPLTAALYLKAVEGRARTGAPIRPAAVSARTHRITRSPGYREAGFHRKVVKDVEDWGGIHVVFEDGTIADLFACELVLGGIHNWLEVAANNHRSRVNINPNTALQTFNPRESQFDGIYTVEKIETSQGWVDTSPDEDWFTGYPQEMNAFYSDIVAGRVPQADSLLAADAVATIYAGYVSAVEKGREAAIPKVDA